MLTETLVLYSCCWWITNKVAYKYTVDSRLLYSQFKQSTPSPPVAKLSSVDRSVVRKKVGDHWLEYSIIVMRSCTCVWIAYIMSYITVMLCSNFAALFAVKARMRRWGRRGRSRGRWGSWHTLYWSTDCAKQRTSWWKIFHLLLL